MRQLPPEIANQLEKNSATRPLQRPAIPEGLGGWYTLSTEQQADRLRRNRLRYAPIGLIYSETWKSWNQQGKEL